MSLLKFDFLPHSARNTCHVVLIYHTPMDMLRCAEFDCNVCNLLQFAPNCSFWKGMYISFVCHCLDDRSIFKWQYSETIVELEVILQYQWAWHGTKRSRCQNIVIAANMFIFLWTLCHACMFLHALYIWNAIFRQQWCIQKENNSWPVSFGLNKFHSPCK